MKANPHNRKEAKPLPAADKLQAEILRDKNVALAKYKETDYEARPLNDPRFDNVVAIYTGEGSLGAGFYVRPDIVLTNWHVVDKSQYVELKTYDGLETFGKVLAKDVRLDLALVKVQKRGKPVTLYKARDLNLGDTVEAIGHPRQLEFTITRGIISAVRKHANVNGVGGKDVLYVQTDAPLSPGNSGGPLFLRDKVIGVNTWARVDKGSQNLNFAVHYSEINNFIAESLTPGS